MKFKTPESLTEQEKENFVDPVTAAASDEPYRVVIGYPKWEAQFSLNPQSTSLKQKFAAGFEPNFSSSSLTAFGIIGRVHFSPEVYVELEGNQSSFKADRVTASGTQTISVQESTASPTNFYAKGFRCWIGTGNNSKWCGGGEIGYAMTAALEFVGPSTLALGTLKDYVLAPSVIYQRGLLPKMSLQTLFSYQYGLGLGQNDSFGFSRHSNLLFNGGFDYEINPRNSWNMRAEYIMSTGSVKGINAGQSTEYDLNAAQLALKLGYCYSWN